jgi:hypothetical protein
MIYVKKEDKTSYLHDLDLDKYSQFEHELLNRCELKKWDLSANDVCKALNSRVCDLEDIVNIEYF